MNKIKEYFKLQDEIYKMCNFTEDWTVYPLDDRTDMYWYTTDETVIFHKDKEYILDKIDELKYYEDELVQHRFYPKGSIYRGENYTLIIVDTHTDGNRFFAIYDNSKEIKNN